MSMNFDEEVNEDVLLDRAEERDNERFAEPLQESDAVEVPLEESPPEDDAEESLSRKDKKRKRGEDLLARQREEFETELREQRAESERRQSEMAGYIQAQQHQIHGVAQQHQQQFSDPLGDVYNENKRLAEDYDMDVRAGRMTAERDAHYRDKWAELERRKVAVAFQQVGAAQPQPPVNPIYARAQMDYPDVMGDRALSQIATARYMERLIRRGAQQDSWEDAEAVLRELREERTGKRPPPTEATKARTSGAYGGAQSAGTTKPRPKTVTLNSDEKAMARGLYFNLPEAEAYKRYARNVKTKIEG